MKALLVPSNAAQRLTRLFDQLEGGEQFGLPSFHGRRLLATNICRQAYEAGLLPDPLATRLSQKLFFLDSLQPGDRRAACRIVALLLDIRKHVGLHEFAAVHDLWPDTPNRRTELSTAGWG